MPASYEQAITLTGDLHARPAGALVMTAGRFSSAVSLTVGDRSADAKSVLAVMGLGATRGQQVTASAQGPDAEAAVAAIISVMTEATRVGTLPLRSAGAS
jgi:phosphocarrier protein HPr